MALLYFAEQLVAKSDVPGVLPNQLINEEIVVTYPYKKNKYYTAIIYDDREVHSLIINIIGDQLETGEILVEYQPFEHKESNYSAVVCIYEQVSKLLLPDDDFDMDKFIIKHKLKLLYTIDFMILQKINPKPNVFSSRYFNTKMRQYKLN